jgi:hypothetical protein
MKIEDLYQSIGDILARMPPQGWSVAYVEARILDDFGEARFFYEAPGMPKARFAPEDNDFDEIDEALRKVRDLMKHENQGVWSHAVVRLEKSGKFHIDFRYE